MSGFKIDRNLSRAALESVSSNTSAEQLRQDVSPVPVKSDTFDARTSGATKEAAAAKLTEQRVSAQAQEARLRALLEKGLPNLPLIGANPAEKTFGTASTKTMPIENASDLKKIETFKEKLSSMDIRELRNLQNSLSEKIQTLQVEIIQLSSTISKLQAAALLDGGELSDEQKATIESLNEQLNAAIKSKHIAQSQYDAVHDELVARKGQGFKKH
jgi:hypothetical protein